LLLVLLVLPLLRDPQGEWNGDVVVCSMQQDEQCSAMGNAIRTARRLNWTEAISRA
jgi:hypothetical protein